MILSRWESMNQLMKAKAIAEYHKRNAKASLLSFLSHTSQGQYLFPKHIRLVIEHLQRVNDGSLKRLIVSMPPRHGKSELISRCFPAYYYLNHYHSDIMIASYSQDLSNDFSKYAKTLVEEYGEGLAGIKLKRDTKSMSKWGSTTGRGIVNAVGIGGAGTGKGFNLGVIDDPIKNLEEAMNQTYLDKVYNWYKSVFFTRQAPKASIILVMTRWSENDLVARIVADSKEGEWTVLEIPAEATEDEDILGRNIGEYLWTDRFDIETYDSFKASLGSSLWKCLYQQQPTAESGSMFKRAWFKLYTALPQLDQHYISLDASFKGEKTSDYVVMQAWGRKGVEYYLIDQVKDKMDFITTVATFRNFCSKHHSARAKYIEDKANGSAIISTLKKDIDGIIAINPKESKEARARAVSPLFEAGNIYVPNVVWIEDYISEFLAFPLGKHDDQVDATTQVLNATHTKGLQHPIYVQPNTRARGAMVFR